MEVGLFIVAFILGFIFCFLLVMELDTEKEELEKYRVGNQDYLEAKDNVWSKYKVIPREDYQDQETRRRAPAKPQTDLDADRKDYRLRQQYETEEGDLPVHVHDIGDRDFTVYDYESEDER